MQNYVTWFFFEKNLFPRKLKPLITKWKIWIGSSILPKEALETCNYPEYVLRLQKNVRFDKNQKFIYFFCEGNN